ncbi:histone-lysine N-methyltransferase SETMAR-like isoform X1 [Equus quagga]|uniref:histone-lysine N-methyltransferase SETMAR-like isoform X1 n=1 Tax=Equus quagga TaxID=89248 RepID=UPI001EE376E7|nr:histone-lysine N-methyltransferase SETMAR-like isoform X1 [Equus quagga]
MACRAVPMSAPGSEPRTRGAGVERAHLWAAPAGPEVPVACKTCPCGYVFINRKLLKIKHSEKSSPFTEVNDTISLKDLRILFLYEFKLGHSAAMASRNINSVFGEGCVSERTVRWWFEKFRSGDLSLKNEPRGRPKCVLNQDKLRAMVEANPKTAIRGLAADLGVSATTISRHLAAIGKITTFSSFGTLSEKQNVLPLRRSNWRI